MEIEDSVSVPTTTTTASAIGVGSEIQEQDSEKTNECREIDDGPDPEKGNQECRICLQNLHEDNRIAIELGCLCKNGLGAAHKDCAEKWFKKKPTGADRICEVCGYEAKNVVHPRDLPASTSTSELIRRLSQCDCRRFFLTCVCVCLIIIGLTALI